MTTPPCPRCGALLVVQGGRYDGKIWCTGETADGLGCAYGNDAPRTLVPQPDVVGVASLSRDARMTIATCMTYRFAAASLYGADDGEECRRIEAARAELAAHPAPTPQRTDAGEVADNGLLPCPFCGGPAFDDFDDPDGAGHIVGCDNRACPINPEKFMDHVGEDHDVRAGLRAAWNTRGKT